MSTLSGSSLWGSTVSGYGFRHLVNLMPLTVYSLGVYSLGVYSLGVYSLVYSPTYPFWIWISTGLQ